MVPYLQKRMKSFANALQGVAFLISSQPHARIHLVSTLTVIAGALFLNLEGLEWCLLIVAIMAVWVAEGMNTALEALADAVCPEHHPLVGRAKDVAAAAVLFAALGAVIIGLLVFGRHVL